MKPAPKRSLIVPPLPKIFRPFEPDDIVSIWNNTTCEAQRLRFTREPSRRLRWPIGRRSASVLGWVVTSRQVERGMLTEECRLARDQRLGHETISKTDPARRGWYVGTKYTREATAVAQHVLRAPGIRENPRQGWSPTGEVLA